MKTKTIKAYKGFDKDLKCRGFQYEIGKEYKEREAKVCNCGFHACENPLDVLDYYGDIDNRFCEVEQFGELSREVGSSKIASSKIKIKAEIGFCGLFKAGIEWIKQLTSPQAIIDETKGKNSSGNSAQIGSSGNSAQIGSSGNSAKIGSSGDYAQIGSSGNSAKIGSSGDSAQIGSSGNSAKIDSTGEDSVICCAGPGGSIKAKVGSWITLSEWIYSNNKKRYVPKCVKTYYVDGEIVKADTWYQLVDGELKEVKEDDNKTEG